MTNIWIQTVLQNWQICSPRFKDTKVDHEIFLNREIRDKLNSVQVNLTWSLVESPSESPSDRTRRSENIRTLAPILDIQNRQG